MEKKKEKRKIFGSNSRLLSPLWLFVMYYHLVFLKKSLYCYCLLNSSKNKNKKLESRLWILIIKIFKHFYIEIVEMIYRHDTGITSISSFLAKTKTKTKTYY